MTDPELFKTARTKAIFFYFKIGNEITHSAVATLLDRNGADAVRGHQNKTKQNKKA